VSKKAAKKKAAPKKAAKKAAPKKAAKKKAPKKAAKKKASKKAAHKKAAKKKAAPKKAAPNNAAKKKSAPKKAAPKKAAPKKAAKKKAAPKKAAKKKAAPKRKAAKKKAAAAEGMDARQSQLANMTVAAHPDSGLSKRQVKQLHQKLVEERARKVAELERHMQEALGEPNVMPDETDMAQRSTEQAYLIRFADKERKLLNEIERALDKLRTGDYGVCEGTEEAIGFKRLELRPWTRYSVAYKEQIERERSQHRR
jgi:RNA polymerase-binding protein DksA